MKAIGAMEDARAAGIALAVDGDDLVLEAASRPPAAVLDALARNKAEIVALLRGGGWSAKDWQTFFDERAGMAEIGGLLTRRFQVRSALLLCGAARFPKTPLYLRPSSGRHRRAV